MQIKKIIILAVIMILQCILQYELLLSKCWSDFKEVKKTENITGALCLEKTIKNKRLIDSLKRLRKYQLNNPLKNEVLFSRLVFKLKRSELIVSELYKRKQGNYFLNAQGEWNQLIDLMIDCQRTANIFFNDLLVVKRDQQKKLTIYMSMELL